jgi:hypothetical protein
MSSLKPYEILPKLLQGLAGAAVAVLVVWGLAYIAGLKNATQALPGTEKARAEARHAIKAEIDKSALTLHDLKWLDKDKGTVHLPIERAMELSATQLAAKEVKPSGVTVAWIAPKMPDYTAPKEEPAPATVDKASAVDEEPKTPAAGAGPAPTPAPAPAPAPH